MASEDEVNNEQHVGFIANTTTVVTGTGARRHTGRLALQTGIIHLCCSVACIIIGVFSLSITKSKTMEKVYGLPLWIGLLLLLTGLAGIQCHVRKTKIYAALYLTLSFFAMFFNLVGIAWLLSTMKKSEVAVISLVCVSTFDMGISCLSSALGCHILFTDCKLFMHPRGNGHSPDVNSPEENQLVHVNVPTNQTSSPRTYQETVRLSTSSPGQARYLREPTRLGDVPPSYSEAVGPPPSPPPAYTAAQSSNV